MISLLVVGSTGEHRLAGSRSPLVRGLSRGEKEAKVVCIIFFFQGGEMLFALRFCSRHEHALVRSSADHSLLAERFTMC